MKKVFDATKFKLKKLFFFKEIFLDFGNTLVAYVMLDFTAVAVCGFLVHTHYDKRFCNNVVTLENTLGYFSSLFGQKQASVVRNGYVAVFPELFHGYGNACLCKTQLICHVNASHISVSQLQNKYCFKIIFSRFENFNFKAPLSAFL